MEVSASTTSSNNAAFERYAIIVLHDTEEYATSKGERRD